jgi:hypothetical protein
MVYPIIGVHPIDTMWIADIMDTSGWSLSIKGY